MRESVRQIMKTKNTGLLPKWLETGFVNLLSPIVDISVRLNMHPNTYTVLGLLLTSMSAVILIWDPSYMHWAGFFILIGGMCDVLDGKLARQSGQTSRFGALFDSSIDRYSEVIMFFGIAAYYVGNKNYLLSVATFAALGGSTMVSYVRARAEGLGFDAKVGFMQRPERVVLIGAGALFYYPLFPLTVFHITNFPVTLLDIVIWFVALFANITAIQRMVYVYKQDVEKK